MRSFNHTFTVLPTSIPIAGRISTFTGSTALLLPSDYWIRVQVKYSVLRHALAPEQRRLNPAYEIMITMMLWSGLIQPHQRKSATRCLRMWWARVACY